MRDDVQEVLGNLQPHEARLLSKRDYQRCFEAMPASEPVLAAIPVVFSRVKGPLVVTDRELLFLSASGNRVAAPLSDVGASRYRMSFLSRRGFRLSIEIGPDELPFGSQAGREETVVWFLGVLDQAKADDALRR